MPTHRSVSSQLIDGAECAGGVRQSDRRSPHQFSSLPSQGRPAAGAQMHPRPRTTIDSPSWRSGSIGGMTPLFWTHVLPYGEVRLDMTARLTLGAGGTPPAG